MKFFSQVRVNNVMNMVSFEEIKNECWYSCVFLIESLKLIAAVEECVRMIGNCWSMVDSG